MKKYIKPEAKSIEFPDPVMDTLELHVSRRDGDGEASRESKFGFEESDTEDHENFWDE